MLSFQTFILEALLLEDKAWHQFIKQNGLKLLQKFNTISAVQTDHAKAYQTDEKILNSPGYGTPEHLTDYISNILNIKDTHHEDGMWILKKLHTGEIPRLEDVSRVKNNLAKLRSYKDKGIQVPALSGIKNHSELNNAVQDLENLPSVELKNDLSELHPDEYQIIGENEHWHVVLPHTHEAACVVGRGSNWCTQDADNFEHYQGTGELISLIPRNPKIRNERYQFHIPLHDMRGIQAMDMNDIPIGIHSIPNFSERPLPEILHPKTIRFGHLGDHVHFTLDVIKKIDSALRDQPITFNSEKEKIAVLSGIAGGGNDSHITNLFKNHRSDLDPFMMNTIIYRSTTRPDVIKTLGKRKLKKDHISHIIDNLDTHFARYTDSIDRNSITSQIIEEGNVDHISKLIDKLGKDFNYGNYESILNRVYRKKDSIPNNVFAQFHEKIIDNVKNNIPQNMAHDILRYRIDEPDGGEGIVDKILSKGPLDPKFANGLLHGTIIHKVKDTIIKKLLQSTAEHSKIVDASFKSPTFSNFSVARDARFSSEQFLNKVVHRQFREQEENQKAFIKENEETLIDLLKSIHHRRMVSESLAPHEQAHHYDDAYRHSLTTLFEHGSDKLRHVVIDTLVYPQTIVSKFYPNDPTHRILEGDRSLHADILRSIDKHGNSAMRDKFMHNTNYALSDEAAFYITKNHINNPEYEPHIKKIIDSDIDYIKDSRIKNSQTVFFNGLLYTENASIGKKHEFLDYIIDSAHRKGALTPGIQQLFTKDYYPEHRQKIMKLLGKDTDKEIIRAEIRSGGYHIDNVLETFGSSLPHSHQLDITFSGNHKQIGRMIDLNGKNLSGDVQEQIIGKPYNMTVVYNRPHDDTEVISAKENIDKILKLHGPDLKSTHPAMLKLQTNFAIRSLPKHLGDLFNLVGNNFHHSVLPYLMANKHLTDDQANRVLDIIQNKIKNNRSVGENSSYAQAINNYINRSHTTPSEQTDPDSGRNIDGIFYRPRQRSEYHDAIDNVLRRFSKTHSDLIRGSSAIISSIDSKGNDDQRNAVYKMFNP